MKNIIDNITQNFQDLTSKLKGAKLLNVYYDNKPNFYGYFSGTEETAEAAIWFKIDKLDKLIVFWGSDEPFVQVGIFSREVDLELVENDIKGHSDDDHWKDYLNKEIKKVEIIEALTTSEHYEIKHVGALRLHFENKKTLLLLYFGTDIVDGQLKFYYDDQLTIAFDESFLSKKLWQEII